MKKRKWFQTNLAFSSTKNQIYKAQYSKPRIVTYFDENKGRLTFCIDKYKDVKIQVTSKSKLGLFYPEDLDFNKILKQIKPLIITANNQLATIKNEIKIKTKDTLNEEKNSLQRKTEKAIVFLRFLLMRDPTITEIAYQIGEIPDKTKKLAFSLSPKLKWKEPSEDQMKIAKNE